jgi:PAS domain S-box-containing protein
MVKSHPTTEDATKGNPSRTPVRLRRLNIGPRLTACFVIIVFLMGTVDFVAVWQFKRIEISARRFYQVDQKSLAVMRAHLDLMEFREALLALANAQDERRFAVEAALQRDRIVQDVQRAEETLKSFQYPDSNVAITLEVVGRSLPQQADALVQLANAGDWQGVRLRLANQVHTLVGLTSQLVHDVNQEVTHERAQALASTQRVRDQLALVLSLTSVFTLLMAIMFGWYATRSITGPLATLDKGAKALASGNFQHQIDVEGEDELARLGGAFNYATLQVRELYDELKANEARFRALIEHSSDLIMIVDRGGKIRYVSPASLRVTGRTQEELQERDLTDFVPSEDVPKIRAALRGVPWNGSAPVEIGFRRADGSLAAIELLANDLFDESAVAGVVVNARDITERKRAEEALREVRADLAHVSRVTTLGELTASLAHEIRQPITAAVTDATTLLCWLNRNDPDLEEARQAASRVVQDATRAAEIISRMRKVFQKGSAQRELVDINEIIREMIVLLRGETTQYNILVGTDLAADLPQVMADRVHLQQVMMNLIINGIEAMKDAEWKRELAIKSRRAETHQVMVSVNDTGVGLPPQQAAHIFDAFFTTKPHGTGMGLRISRSIIESHGGRLWAADNSPRGASFHFTLSAKIEAPE